MARRPKSQKLSQPELERFLAAAAALNEACCAPLLAAASDDCRALDDLSAAICEAIGKITGQEPPWMQRGPDSIALAYRARNVLRW